jgi:hypothetical protein
VYLILKKDLKMLFSINVLAVGQTTLKNKIGSQYLTGGDGDR